MLERATLDLLRCKMMQVSINLGPNFWKHAKFHWFNSFKTIQNDRLARWLLIFLSGSGLASCKQWISRVQLVSHGAWPARNPGRYICSGGADGLISVWAAWHGSRFQWWADDPISLGWAHHDQSHSSPPIAGCKGKSQSRTGWRMMTGGIPMTLDTFKMENLMSWHFLSAGMTRVSAEDPHQLQCMRCFLHPGQAGCGSVPLWWITQVAFSNMTFCCFLCKPVDLGWFGYVLIWSSCVFVGLILSWRKSDLEEELVDRVQRFSMSSPRDSSHREWKGDFNISAQAGP